MTTQESKGVPLGRDFFARPVNEVARSLIGCVLTRDGVGGTIVEVEAYGVDDPASHGFRGRTARNGSMFGAPGRAYVYVSYGIHHCMNLVTGPEGRAEAVLVRALEPTAGLEEMQERRGRVDPRDLCSGPGKLCQALGITLEDDGADLAGARFAIHGTPTATHPIVSGPRIGISRGVDLPWRHCLEGSAFLSRPALPEGATRRPRRAVVPRRETGRRPQAEDRRQA